LMNAPTWDEWAVLREVHASFRPCLATTPLRFANPSPPSGWVEDFHFQAAGHAQHTVPCRHSCRHSGMEYRSIRVCYHLPRQRQVRHEVAGEGPMLHQSAPCLPEA
jgi:hypothetical protein